MSARTERVFAVVVGSGFAGLGAAITLKRHGIDDFVVLEKADALGGTWRENTYPGCACDIPSHLYSYSFARNPRWSETYSPSAEIRAYLERCADDFDVRRHVRFGVEVTGAELDEARGEWTVTTASGDRFVGRVVLAGVGPLHRWKLPDVPGLASFRGEVLHSAGWDHAFDPRGKRVAAVGTGASAIQFVPELARDAARLHVFQRTPAWVMPRVERRYTETEKRLFELVPAASWAHRAELFARHELRTVGFVREPRVLALAERLARRHLEQAVREPALRAKLTPTYRMGCKRILMSNTYYPALARPNVEVVAAALERVTPGGVVGPDGAERPVDAIVFGTGFDVHDYLGRARVVGRGGEELGERWRRDGASAYFGAATAGFPNWFTLVGPNTGLGSNSIVFMIEAQLRLVMQAIDLVRRTPGALVEPTREAERRFNDELQAKLRETIWATGCQAWYRDAEGRNSTIWPWFASQFWLRTRRLAREDFRLQVAPSGAARARVAPGPSSLDAPGA